MNKKILIIIGAILVALGVGGYLYSLRNDLPKEAILIKDPQLTDKEKQGFRDKIVELEKEVNDPSKNDGERYKARVQIGLQYFILGEYKNARDQYLLATKMMPDIATAWGELYVVENSMLAYDQANEHIKKALTINSANPQYWRWYLELTGPLKVSDDKIRQTYQEALKQTDNSTDILGLYAGFLEKQNDLVGAVAQWKRAIEKNPAGAAQYQAEIARIQNKLK